MFNINFLLTNPIITAYRGSDLFGKWIFLALFFLSILTWTLFIKKTSYQRRALQLGFPFQEAFRQKYLQPLSLEIATTSHPFAELYRTFKYYSAELLRQYREETPLSSADIELIAAHMTHCRSLVIKRMEKHLFVLSTIVSLAPFLGLLGTVWGILLTFSELQKGSAVHGNELIMGGLAMALGTTVVGLLVAIPALVGYNYLKTSLTQFAAQIDDFSELLLASLHSQYGER